MPSSDPRLLLITPRLTDERLRAPLAGLLAQGGVASVMLDLASTDERSLQSLAKSYAATAHDGGAAALAPATLDSRLVGRAGLDGVQAAGLDGLDAALAAMRPDRIVGVGGLASRDDAMVAGEKEPDYLLFGEPAADGFVRPLDWRVERGGWWAEIFNLPCAVYVAAREEIAALAASGADFLCFGAWLFEAPDGAAILAEAKALLGVEDGAA